MIIIMCNNFSVLIDTLKKVNFFFFTFFFIHKGLNSFSKNHLTQRLFNVSPRFLGVTLRVGSYGFILLRKVRFNIVFSKLNTETYSAPIFYCMIIMVTKSFLYEIMSKKNQYEIGIATDGPLKKVLLKIPMSQNS